MSSIPKLIRVKSPKSIRNGLIAIGKVCLGSWMRTEYPGTTIWRKGRVDIWQSKGSFFKRTAVQYLRLLGIAQTCRFQRKSFLNFLISGEKEIDQFKERKRPKGSKPVNAGQGSEERIQLRQC